MRQQGSQHDYVGHVRLQRVPGAFPRAGAWAIYEGRVGVLAELRNVTADFHVVDALGQTTLTIPGIPLREVIQATLEQIPEQRRPAEHVARKLGYLDGPYRATAAIAVPAAAAPILVAPSPPRQPFLARVLSKLTRRSTGGG